jgi:hypothetical protein
MAGSTLPTGRRAAAIRRNCSGSFSVFAAGVAALDRAGRDI